MDLTERKLKILQAVIADFIKTAEPVGSRTISKNYELGSPATIRNEMSDLEDMGYLTHPHTSSGRVPSEKAYRLYVNQMMGKRDLSEEAKAIIARDLYTNVTEFENLIERATHVLSEITNLTAFALSPGTEQDKLKYINLLPVDETTVVLMLVSDSGKVSNTAVKLKKPASEDTLRILAKNMTYN
ncbi:MAG: heat-inducible transcriptional repressor HrcA, partial [Bacillota bacterium]|nr:heat-inducible transcriptional repressor HrcA [Bacillota bacterium]